MIDPMMLRQAGSIALDIGTIVQIAVMGQAHVFTSAEP
jgi:hypothetical protein